MRIHDTPGKNWSNKNTPPRHYCHFGDGFLIFFDLTDQDSFKNIDFIKNEIYKERDRREIQIALVGMKSDLVAATDEGHHPIRVERSVIDEYLSQDEKLAGYFECSIKDRAGLSGPIQFLINKMVGTVRGGLLSRRLTQR